MIPIKNEWKVALLACSLLVIAFIQGYNAPRGLPLEILIVAAVAYFLVFARITKGPAGLRSFVSVFGFILLCSYGLLMGLLIAGLTGKMTIFRYIP